MGRDTKFSDICWSRAREREGKRERGREREKEREREKGREREGGRERERERKREGGRERYENLLYRKVEFIRTKRPLEVVKMFTKWSKLRFICFESSLASRQGVCLTCIFVPLQTVWKWSSPLRQWGIFHLFPLFLLSGRDSSATFFRVPFPVIPHHPMTSCFMMSAHPQMQLRSGTPHRLANVFQLSACSRCWCCCWCWWWLCCSWSMPTYTVWISKQNDVAGFYGTPLKW